MAHAGNGLKVFYDGSCIVCSREMERYRRRDRGGALKLIDIAAPSFDPVAYGRDLDAFMAQLHVLDASGAFYVGVDAFARIWEVMPQRGFHLLAALIGLPGINLMARGGYRLFARLRRVLPKSTADCRGDTCNIGHRR